MMKKLIAIGMAAGLTSLVSLTSVANEISLGISDEMVDLRLTSDYEQDFFGRLAYLHTDTDDVEADQLSFTFGTVGKLDYVDVMLGLRPYWIDAESESGYGVALGAGASMELIPRFSVSAEVFYSPEILTGSDIDNSLDMEVQLSFQPIENGAVFVGYRDIELELDSGAGDIDVYDSYYLGVSLTF